MCKNSSAHPIVRNKEKTGEHPLRDALRFAPSGQNRRFLIGAIFHTQHTFVLSAVGAAVHNAARLVTMADDPAAAMTAFGRKSMDGAFEAIEIVRDAVGEDLQWFVVFVAANLACLDTGVELGVTLPLQVRL